MSNLEQIHSKETNGLPEEWREAKFSQLLNEKIIIDIQDGNHGERHPLKKDFVPNNIPFITGNCLKSFKLIVDKHQTVTPEFAKRLRVGFSREGDVLLTHKGTIGQTCIVNHGYDLLVLSPQVTYYRLGKNQNHLDSDYLFFFFQSPLFQNELRKLGSAQSTRAYVGITKQKNMDIIIPPIQEQRNIAFVLSKLLFSIEKSQSVLQSLREIKKSLMKHLFTYGAVSLEETTNVKLKETEIGQIPERWELADLNQMAELVMGQSPNGETYNSKGEGTPLLNGPTEYGIKHPHIMQWTTSPTKLCQKDDILFCVRGNTLGRLNIAESSYCIGRGVAAIRGIKTISDTTYLYYFLEFREKVIYNSCAGQNSTFPNISGAVLKKLKVIKPPFLIQKHIAFILSTIDEEIFAIMKERNTLEKMFKSMLCALMSAKIRVNNLEF